jgi:hypothetical protein
MLASQEGLCSMELVSYIPLRSWFVLVKVLISSFSIRKGVLEIHQWCWMKIIESLSQKFWILGKHGPWREIWCKLWSKANYPGIYCKRKGCWTLKQWAYSTQFLEIHMCSLSTYEILNNSKKYGVCRRSIAIQNFDTSQCVALVLHKLALVLLNARS